MNFTKTIDTTSHSIQQCKVLDPALGLQQPQAVLYDGERVGGNLPGGKGWEIAGTHMDRYGVSVCPGDQDSQ